VIKINPKTKRLFHQYTIKFPGLANWLFNSYAVQNSTFYAKKIPAICSERHKLIYIYLPKVACSSIKKSLFPIFDIDENINPHIANFPKRLTWDKLTDNKYYIFTFVRNPWDRLVSFYRDKIRGVYKMGDIEYYRACFGARFYAGMTFEELARLICKIPDSIAEIHFRSQTCSLIHNGKLLPDFIGRYENLEEDFYKMCRMKDLSLTLPHLFNNVPKDKLDNTWEKVDYKTYYSEELKNLVGKRYRKDIEYFNYTFE
jgi:chondroitin 4-sulfotransferase 11